MCIYDKTHTLGNPYPAPIQIPALLSGSVGSGGHSLLRICADWQLRFIWTSLARRYEVSELSSVECSGREGRAALSTPRAPHFLNVETIKASVQAYTHTHTHFTSLIDINLTESLGSKYFFCLR